MGESDAVEEVVDGNQFEEIEDGFVGRWNAQKRYLGVRGHGKYIVENNSISRAASDTQLLGHNEQGGI